VCNEDTDIGLEALVLSQRTDKSTGTTLPVPTKSCRELFVYWYTDSMITMHARPRRTDRRKDRRANTMAIARRTHRALKS